MPNIVCLGELLIDFTSLVPGASIAETPGFEKNPGGAPANVAVGVARLGGSAAFMGMVGDDEFGRFLAGVLDGAGVDTTGLRYSRQAHTTLAFVALREDGEREFVFYRNPGADMLYSAGDVDEDMVKQCRIFCHGSNSMTHTANRNATLTAATLARQTGALVVYDPNIRLNLWDSESSAREVIPLGIPGADMVKLSEEELTFVAGCTDIDAGMAVIRNQGPRAVVVTRGGDACYYSWGECRGSVPTTPVQVIDATGAGDAFLAGILYKLSRHTTRLESYRDDDVEMVLNFAHAVAGRCVGCRGAIPAMPTLDEVMASIGG
jgi:fructokinase